MKKIRNAFIWIIVIFAGIYFIKTMVFDDKVETAEETTTTQTSTPVNNGPAEAEPIPDKPEEKWDYTHTEIRPNGTRAFWFTPQDKVETDSFIVEDCNYGYRVKTDTIIEFKSETTKDITVVKIDGKTGEVFLKRNDSFSTTPWIEKEFVATRNDAESVRFKSTDGTPLQVKAWRYQ